MKGIENALTYIQLTLAAIAALLMWQTCASSAVPNHIVLDNAYQIKCGP